MTTDWDSVYTRDFSEEWEEEPLIEHRRADVCPLCHMKPCMKDCYNARLTHYSGAEADYKRDVEERGRRDMEQWWMNALQPEYNMCPLARSSLGTKRSMETRAKMSAWQVGRKMSPEAIAKTAAANRGNKHTLGYKHTPEALAKMSAASRGRKMSSEAIAKTRAAKAGRGKTSG